MFAGLLDAKEFAEKLPRRLNQLVDAISENRVRDQVDAIDEVLLMSVETSFRILVYPGLAIVFFLVAAISGLVLVFNIVLHDMRAGKKRVRAQQKRKRGPVEGAN